MIINNIKQYGAVSLFIVVFSTLLITVVTVGFISIMVQEQQQASMTDLSQSAYDSAQAGVEDAKRALLYYQNVCGGSDTTKCTQAIKDSFSSTASCNDAVKKLTDVGVSNREVAVQTNGIGNALDQAYTCVKVNLQTDDYVGVLGQDTSKFVPLIGVSDFNTIRIEWFSVKDLQGATTSVNVPSFILGSPLLNQSNWTSLASPNRPSIMRAQFIQFSNKNGFSLSDFDSNTANASNNTLFLYPSNIVDPGKSFGSDVRQTAKNITQIHCEPSLASLVYSCSATIKLPKFPLTIKVGDDMAYLNITALYKKTNYRITLLNGTTPVKFNAVQPSVDSTGRANDLFRRVQSRVELTDTNFPYPEAAVNISDNFCKNFIITDSVDDYSNSCTP